MVKSTRRDSILIEPYKQLRFGVMFLCTNLVFSSIVMILFGYYLWDVYSAVSIYFQLDEQQSRVTLGKLAEPAWIGCGVLFLFILTTLIMSARYTHQIYGPMVSIRRFLDELIAGEVPQQIQLRASDQLQDLADRLNLMANRFRKLRPEPSYEKVCRYMDQLAQGLTPQPLHLPAEDPFAAIGEKLEKISRQMKPK